MYVEMGTRRPTASSRPDGNQPACSHNQADCETSGFAVDRGERSDAGDSVLPNIECGAETRSS